MAKIVSEIVNYCLRVSYVEFVPGEYPCPRHFLGLGTPLVTGLSTIHSLDLRRKTNFTTKSIFQHITDALDQSDRAIPLEPMSWQRKQPIIYSQDISAGALDRTCHKYDWVVMPGDFLCCVRRVISYYGLIACSTMPGCTNIELGIFNWLQNHHNKVC